MVTSGNVVLQVLQVQLVPLLVLVLGLVTSRGLLSVAYVFGICGCDCDICDIGGIGGIGGTATPSVALVLVLVLLLVSLVLLSCLSSNNFAFLYNSQL